jgi:hypothetical protein
MFSCIVPLALCAVLEYRRRGNICPVKSCSTYVLGEEHITLTWLEIWPLNFRIFSSSVVGNKFLNRRRAGIMGRLKLRLRFQTYNGLSLQCVSLVFLLTNTSQPQSCAVEEPIPHGKVGLIWVSLFLYCSLAQIFYNSSTPAYCVARSFEVWKVFLVFWCVERCLVFHFPIYFVWMKTNKVS